MSSLSMEIDAALTNPGRGTEQAVIDLEWSRHDPLAVRFVFGPDRPEWIIGRELLDAGRAAPAGVGDVTVRPDPVNPEIVAIFLSVPSGRCTIEVDAIDLHAFLMAVDARVPLDADVDVLVPDEELAELLRFEGDGSCW